MYSISVNYVEMSREIFGDISYVITILCVCIIISNDAAFFFNEQDFAWAFKKKHLPARPFWIFAHIISLEIDQHTVSQSDSQPHVTRNCIPFSMVLCFVIYDGLTQCMIVIQMHTN